MPSLDILSLDMVSFDMLSFFMLSLDMLSFFMESSLPILSWAKAAGASARLSERAAAEIPSATRVRMVMVGDPFENWFLKATGAALCPTRGCDRLLQLTSKNFRTTGVL